MFEFLEPIFGPYTGYVIVALIIVGALAIAKILSFIIKKTLLRVTEKTKSHLDDLILEAINKPIYIGLFIVAIHYSTRFLPILEPYLEAIAFYFMIIYAVFIGFCVVIRLRRRVYYYGFFICHAFKAMVYIILINGR